MHSNAVARVVNNLSVPYIFCGEMFLSATQIPVTRAYSQRLL